jgi:cytochrome b6-f complex subunit 5
MSASPQAQLRRGEACKGRGVANATPTPTPALFKLIFLQMVEPLLSGIVLGLIPVTLSGLFVTAYLQYRRGDQMNF